MTVVINWTEPQVWTHTLVWSTWSAILSIESGIFGRLPMMILQVSRLSERRKHLASSVSRVKWIFKSNSTGEGSRMQWTRYSTKGSTSSEESENQDEYSFLWFRADCLSYWPAWVADQVRYTRWTHDRRLELSMQSLSTVSAGVIPIPTAKRATTL